MTISAKELSIKLLLHSGEYYSKKEIEYIMFMNPNKLLKFTAIILTDFEVTSLSNQLGTLPVNTGIKNSATLEYNQSDTTWVKLDTNENQVFFSNRDKSYEDIPITFEEYGRLFVFIRQ